MKVWDTASQRLVVAADGPLATLYACGITPYDATHIGHAATYIAWDLLVRGWRDSGLGVRYAQNVTDVDDPLLERAERDRQDWRELASREVERYRSDMRALRVLPPDHFVGAVEALDVIGELSGVLADRGALYELDGDVYFCRSADPEFGTLSGLSVAEMTELCAERGGDPGRAGKKDPLDPLVWLAGRPGEPSWGSRFGQGRPGWHIECAAIATRYLGVAFDVQAGGSDLIFPHHEMSASHARVALSGSGGHKFARHYVHAGMVRLGGEKMSKSLGNLVFVSALLGDGVDPMAIRLAILAHHYRHDWDWTGEGLDAGARRLGNWRRAVAAALSGSAGVARVARVAGGSGRAADGLGEAADGLGEAADGPGDAGLGVLAAIRERIASDLDAPGALAVVDAWADDVLGTASAASAASVTSAALVRDAVDALLGVQI